MATTVGSYQSSGVSTALTVFNLPYTADETEVRSIFPTAQRVHMVRRSNESNGSQNMCIIQFDSSYECQKVYAECQSGKEVAGRKLHVEYNQGRSGQPVSDEPHRNTAFTGNDTYDRQSHQSSYSSNDSYVRSAQNARNYTADNSRHGNNSNCDARSEGGCNLTVSNLPYTATERDVWNEFPEALKVVLNMDERGRSRGTAQLSFPNRDQCNAALQSCNYKMLNGRPIRGRIIRESDNGQSENNRQRDFGGRQNFSGHHNDYNADRRTHDNRFNSGSRGSNRGGGQRNSMRGGGNRFGNRDSYREDESDRRRDRSPARDEPIRGYGSSKGPRITSAVINRSGDLSSESSSDED